jgi:LasA protease
VDAGDHIGHPSCEGGMATGTHLHIARKYNGEWVGAGGALPFVLSGWMAHQGDAPYYGWLSKGDKIVTSSKAATYESHIIRQPDE